MTTAKLENPLPKNQYTKSLAIAIKPNIIAIEKNNWIWVAFVTKSSNSFLSSSNKLLKLGISTVFKVDNILELIANRDNALEKRPTAAIEPKKPKIVLTPFI